MVGAAKIISFMLENLAIKSKNKTKMLNSFNKMTIIIPVLDNFLFYLKLNLIKCFIAP